MAWSFPERWPTLDIDGAESMKTTLFIAVHLLLLAAASYFGAGIFYQAMIGDAGLPLVPATAGRTDDSAFSKTVVHPLSAYRSISERNLFRTDDPNKIQQGPKEVDLTALQETELDIRLWGTLVLDKGGRNYAVIEDKKAGGQYLYQVGDKIQEAMVKLILRERVVLDVGGKDEILQIEELAAAGAAGGRIQPAPTIPEAPSAPEPVSREVNLDRKIIDEAMANIGELMKQVRIRPFFEGGNPAGLSLVGVAPGSIFQQMGIRNGDVLQAVDGQPILTVDDVVNFYQSLSSADNLAIQIRRGGRIVDIQYKIE